MFKEMRHPGATCLFVSRPHSKPGVIAEHGSSVVGPQDDVETVAHPELMDLRGPVLMGQNVLDSLGL